MDTITPAQIWAAVLAAASAFLLLSNATEKIVKAVKAAKAPSVQQNEKQDARLTALEKWQEEVNRKLNHDNDRLKDIEGGTHALMHASLALLDHGIDGNNIKQMQDAKSELQEHLINR